MLLHINVNCKSVVLLVIPLAYPLKIFFKIVDLGKVPDHHQSLNDYSISHFRLFLKVSSKSVGYFLHYPEIKQANKLEKLRFLVKIGVNYG